MRERLSRVMSRKVVLLDFDEVVRILKVKVIKPPDAVARYMGHKV